MSSQDQESYESPGGERDKDISDQEREYNAKNFDKYTTKSIRKNSHSEYYARKVDDPEFKKYLRDQRTCISEPEDRRERNEEARAYVSGDNEQAANDRKDNKVATIDFAYQKDAYLRTKYKTAENRREGTEKGEASGNREYKKRDA